MRKIFAVISVVVLAGMLITACGGAAATPETVTVVQTVVVEGTPQVQVVVATPAPEAKPAVLRINLNSYPDIVDPQKSSFVNEIAHLKLMYEGLTKFNEKLETVPGSAEKWSYKYLFNN